MKLPESFGKVVGELPASGRLPDGQEFPFGTLRPVRDGFVERNDVKSSYGVYGEQGPWIAFAPIFQIAHSQMLKGVVPYLSEHFRVFTMDLRGNGRSDRPRGQAAYTFDEYYADFVAALDAAGVDKAAVIGISANSMVCEISPPLIGLTRSMAAPLAWVPLMTMVNGPPAVMAAVCTPSPPT